jgi:hypothetical protein
MWEALQQAGWVTTLATSRVLYGLVSVVHYVAICFCVGTIILRDLRILGLAGRDQALSLLAAQLRPLIWIGFAVVVVSGFLLFTTEAGEFAAVAPFRVKMLVVVLAVISSLTVEWSVPKWDRALVVPVKAKLLALLSILLWLGAILAGVEVPALTGLG